MYIDKMQTNEVAASTVVDGADYPGKSCQNCDTAECPLSELQQKSVHLSSDRHHIKRHTRADYIVYGQMCLASDPPELMGYEIHVLRPEKISLLGLLAESSEVDKPVTVITRNATYHV